MNKLKVLSILMIILLIGTSIAAAEQVTPCADLYFDSATAFLAADKLVIFDLSTYEIYDQIRVTSVWLEKKVDGEWETVKSLPVPTNVAENTISYGAVMDYSSYIGTGTFCIGFTADADGHTITRHSNSRIF